MCLILNSWRFHAFIDLLVNCGGRISQSLLFNDFERELNEFPDAIQMPNNIVLQEENEVFGKNINLFPNPNTGTFQIEPDFSLSEIGNFKPQLQDSFLWWRY